MKYSAYRVNAHLHFDVPSEHLTQPHCDRLMILLCAGGSTVDVPSGLAGIWWPVRGQALALTSDSRIAFDRRSVFVSDSQRSHSVSIQTSSGAIALIGSQTLWNSVISLSETSVEPAIFPAVHPADPMACKQLLRFLRLVAANTTQSLEPSKVMHLATALEQFQRPFTPLIARCPGRSLSRQKTVFLRLQRVRNYLSHSTQPDLDVGKLALTTNYSVWRFIRVYYSVFGETPYSYISRCRVDRARKLLEGGEQCVGDIALAVGFENGSSLTRAIKRHYGVSASQMRRAKNRLDVRSRETLV